MTAQGPFGKGLNGYIKMQSFQFQTLDDAIKLLGPNFFMAKIDLWHAYGRSLFIIEILQLLVYVGSLRDMIISLMYDTRLPYGAISSPEIFHRLSQSVWRMMAR